MTLHAIQTGFVRIKRAQVEGHGRGLPRRLAVFADTQWDRLAAHLRLGNFISLSGLRTDRFLDPPELEALHDSGNNVSLFDRFDFRPGTNDTLHLNIQAANSGFDVPNTYDQIQQTQHQKIATFNVAPGYSRVIGSNTCSRRMASFVETI